MDTENYLTVAAPVSEVSHSNAHEVAMAQFNFALTACLQGWSRGDGLIVLQDNIQELFGNVLFEYFKRTLLEIAGESATLTVMSSEDGNHTIVRMSKKEMAQIPSQEHLNAEPVLDEPSQQTIIDKNAAAVETVMEKVSRPMNCWIIYRDSKHKELKAKYPHLTVQQISTLCSEEWHKLSPEDKKPWKDAAQSAKEEHLRQHPGYKYSPRKPGQKKKRQSRKAKRAASNTTGQEVLNFQLASGTSKSASPPPVEHATATTTVLGDNVDVFFSDMTHLTGPTSFLDMFSQGSMSTDPIHDSESFRHTQLDAEFGASFDIDMSLALFDDEAFAFRDGADGNATLPSIFTDSY